ncbi:phosphatase PAP2 family protein [Flavobacterium oreochromis]|uniref:phosphatase PAP2 family protein n=1 Tax=Flavobacterium oreochromis TaxID=2906078 RepID=UPI00385DE29C
MRKIAFYYCLLLNMGLFSQINDTLVAIKTDKIESQDKTQSYEIDLNTTRIYNKPRILDAITFLPKDFINTSKDFVAKDHGWYLGGAVASTAMLVPFDQSITNSSREFSDRIGLSPNNIYGKFGPLQNIPKNVGAGLYLIGNGTTVILLMAGFTTFGLLSNDYRALSTASGLVESLALSGVYVQFLKRVTGRESPFIARENGHPGGEWNPFPSFPAYAKSTPHYDAMPSGHLTTIMSALTVITTNYPDYKWIKPVGYTLIAGMCFQMVQSEVHWISDYPLALLIGYFSGKNIAKRRFKDVNKNIGLQLNKPKYQMNVIGANTGAFKTLGLSITF